MQDILYITSNAGKFEEASLILNSVQLKQKNVDTVEIQGKPEDIIKDKASQLAQKIQQAFIVEDVSFSLSCLNGFPGPYIKDFLYAVGEKGLFEIAEKFNNYKASTICFAAYCFPGDEPIYCSGEIFGTLVPPKGGVKHGKVSYNSVFKPDGYSQTFGEMSMEDHAKMSHRFHALKKLKQHFK